MSTILGSDYDISGPSVVLTDQAELETLLAQLAARSKRDQLLLHKGLPPATVETYAVTKPFTPDASDTQRLAWIEARRWLPCEQPADMDGPRTLRCMMCSNPFDRGPRSEEEMEQIRRSLLIQNHSRPAICDNCLGTHEHWRRQAQGPRGEKFHVTPNFLLRHQERWPNGEPR